MSRASVFLASLVLVALTATSAEARHYTSRYGYGGRGGGGGGTVYGSAATGLGNLIRAQGAYNQMTAQAMIALEQAKDLQITNRLKAAQAVYQLRRLNEEEHAIQERKRAAAYGEPPPVKIRRLTPSQLDPVTGAITWPAVLQTPDFAVERAALDHDFAIRASDPGRVTNTEVEHLVDRMHTTLDQQHDILSTSDFFAARHFLEAVAGESRTIVPVQ